MRDKQRLDKRGVKVLFVEHIPADVELCLYELGKGGFDPEWQMVETREVFINQLRTSFFDIVLADYNLPFFSGMEALELLLQIKPQIPLIIVSGAIGDESAADCIRQGAANYVLKDNLVRLPSAVAQALELYESRKRQEKYEKEREELLNQLAAKNEELRSFIYNFSHDLKNFMGVIDGYTHLLLKNFEAISLENRLSYIRSVREANSKMKEMIRDLLDFAQIGNVAEPEMSIPLVDLVKNSLRSFQPEITERGITVYIDPDLPVVYGRKKSLGRVIDNLLSNAIKYLGDGNRAPLIEIGKKEEKTAEGSQKGQTVVFVRDNGSGIKREYHQQIFGLFQRFPSSSNIEGSGMGLAIVKKIIELHGGQVWVDSEEGKGSTFFVTLPTSKTA